jgi:dTDP-4-dehydrorhamnose reductase
MRVLLTGAKGQLGFELHKKLLSIGEVIATDRYNLDLGNPEFIRSFLNEIKPDIIVNPAAYTQVDKAENEVKLAYQINALAPKVLTEKAREFNIPIIHNPNIYNLS